MLKRRLSGLCIGFLVTALCLVTSCDVPYHDDEEFFLEIVNEAIDPVSVQIGMKNSSFQIRAEDRPYGDERTGILVLNSKEKRVFALHTYMDPPVDAGNVRDFREIHFYDTGTDNPYKSYVYPGYTCGSGSTCRDSGDDTLLVYLRSDGARERLFVASSDRPFYLERDKQDSDLARLVITFVPSADSLSKSPEVLAR